MIFRNIAFQGFLFFFGIAILKVPFAQYAQSFISFVLYRLPFPEKKVYRSINCFTASLLKGAKSIHNMTNIDNWNVTVLA